MKKILFLIIIFPFLLSCVIVIENPIGPPTFRTYKSYHKEVSFKSGNMICIRNGFGDIEIQGWDEEKVEVVATISPRLAYKRRAYFYEINRNSPKIKLDEFEDFLKIETEYREIPEEEFLVDYSLNVPHFVIVEEINNVEGDIFISDIYGEISVELVRGDVRVENFSGSLNISVEEGLIKTSLHDLREDDQIRITDKKGDIIVFLEPEADFLIDAKTPNGRIECEFLVKKSSSDKELKYKVGKGGAILSLITFDGNIEIRKL